MFNEVSNWLEITRDMT